MHEVTWGEILQSFEAVLAYCREIGLGPDVEESRFGRHRARIVSLIEADGSAGPEAVNQIYRTAPEAHIVALAEAGELATMETFLKRQSRALLQRKLRDILRGPDLPSEEGTNSNHARNILFELNMGDRLARAGLPPVLGDRPDLSCEIDGFKILLECKRPLTARGARDGIAKACDMLSSESASDSPSTPRDCGDVNR